VAGAEFVHSINVDFSRIPATLAIRTGEIPLFQDLSIQSQGFMNLEEMIKEMVHCSIHSQTQLLILISDGDLAQPNFEQHYELLMRTLTKKGCVFIVVPLPSSVSGEV
jgi:hypothetical protein